MAMKIRPVEGSLVSEVGTPQSRRLLRRSSHAVLCCFLLPVAEEEEELVVAALSATLMMCLSVAMSRPPPALSLAKQNPTSGACKALLVLEEVAPLMLLETLLAAELAVALRSGDTM